MRMRTFDHATLSRGALLSFAAVAAVFIFAAFRSLFARYLLPFPFRSFRALCSFRSFPFCRSFVFKRLQRSLHTVLNRFKRLKFSACTFIPFAPFEPFV